jgi:hypothetical protein
MALPACVEWAVDESAFSKECMHACMEVKAKGRERERGKQCSVVLVSLSDSFCPTQKWPKGKGVVGERFSSPPAGSS